MASVQTEDDRDTTDEEIAARESIPVGHTGSVWTYPPGLVLSDHWPSEDSYEEGVELRRLLHLVRNGTIRSAVLVERTEDGWHDLLTIHND